MRTPVWMLGSLAAVVLYCCGPADEPVDEPADDGVGDLEVRVVSPHMVAGQVLPSALGIALRRAGDDVPGSQGDIRWLRRGPDSWAIELTEVAAREHYAELVVLGSGGEDVHRTSFPVRVEDGGTAGLFFGLACTHTGTPLKTPWFDAVFVDKLKVTEGGVVTITASASGGQGRLRLAGRQPASYRCDDPAKRSERCGSWSAPVPADFMSGGQATIQWTAPLKSGPVWIVLQVLDQKGNAGELSILLFVTPATGTLLVKAEFNAAPHIAVRVRTFDKPEGTSFELAVRGTDLDGFPGSLLDFRWLTNCAGAFTDELGDPVDDETGALTSAVERSFRWIVPGGSRRGQCAMTLEVADAEGARSTIIVQLQDRLPPTGAAGE